MKEIYIYFDDLCQWIYTLDETYKDKKYCLLTKEKISDSKFRKFERIKKEYQKMQIELATIIWERSKDNDRDTTND